MIDYRWLLPLPYIAVLLMLTGLGQPSDDAKLIDIFSSFLLFGLVRFFNRLLIGALEEWRTQTTERPQ